MTAAHQRLAVRRRRKATLPSADNLQECVKVTNAVRQEVSPIRGAHRGAHFIDRVLDELRVASLVAATQRRNLALVLVAVLHEAQLPPV